MIFPSPETAEFTFYSAFESGDLDTMMAVWESSETIICIHPLGPQLQGIARIRDSWRQIFSSGATVRFNIETIQDTIQDNLAIRIVYESITVIGADEQPSQPLIATNIYRHTGAGWHMILHHASPGPGVSTRGETSGQLH
jgi:ketosteroid isomerase-like protein